MKNERCLIKKITKRIMEMFIFPIMILVGLTFIMGFYYERNIYVKLNDITLELGDKLPEEIINYIGLIGSGSSLSMESNIPLDSEGRTKMIGRFNYYLVYNDDNYRFSKLTNVKSTIRVIDTVKPVIKAKENAEIEYDSSFDIHDIAECIDLSDCKMTTSDEVDTANSGKHKIIVKAVDGGNNVSYQEIEFIVKDKPQPVFANYTINIAQNDEKNATLSEDEKAALRQEVVNFAKQFVGNPYVYGGTSLTNGTDCSGFTMSVYANFGYSLPRSSNDYPYIGKVVDAGEALPGDIVVYAGHVGIYAGNGMMVHASTPATGILYAPVYNEYHVFRRIIY